MRTNPLSLRFPIVLLLLLLVVSPFTVVAWNMMYMKQQQQHPNTNPVKRAITSTQNHNHHVDPSVSRRLFWKQPLSKTGMLVTTSLALQFSSSSSWTNMPAAVAATIDSGALEDLKISKSKLEPIPDLLEQKEWDKVRSILKLPPVNKLWNLGDSQNPVLKLAKQTGDVELFEMKDDLALTLQLCDQLTYDNAFVYFQPGSGKFNIKEPQALAKQAMRQIQAILDVVNEASS